MRRAPVLVPFLFKTASKRRVQTDSFWLRRIFFALAIVSPTASMAQEIIAQGSTPNGFPYSIWADGSGLVTVGESNWSIDCRPDAMTDERRCEIDGGKRHDFSVKMNRKGGISEICVTGHDFPGRTGAIRFDQSKAIETDQDGCIAGSYGAHMLKATSARTRTVEWPYDEYIDRETPLMGFSDTYGLAVQLNKNLQK